MSYLWGPPECQPTSQRSVAFGRYIFWTYPHGRPDATGSSLSCTESMFLDQKAASEIAKVDMAACKVESKELWLLEGKTVYESLLCIILPFSLILQVIPGKDGLNYFDSWWLWGLPLDDRGMWVIEGWEAGKKGRAEKHLHTESEKMGTIEKE